MQETLTSNKCMESIVAEKEILIIQDIDGVCIPLVKDPLKREIHKNYIHSASLLKGQFYVLTCGEHEGGRGVNRLIEKALGPKINPSKAGLYLPGLAACGVEYQDVYGNITHLGLNQKEIFFLKEIPQKMESLLRKELSIIFPKISKEKIIELTRVAVCDTRFTPTLNLNEIFILASDDIDLQLKLQKMMEDLMNKLIEETKGTGLEQSFYLHMMPNLGKVANKEVMKYATEKDIGTTDIQFIINGAVKEAGLLVLLNKYISFKTGTYPFGDNFNVRNAPKSSDELINLCLEKIPHEQMPLLVGVGDTVTSNWSESDKKWMRGGSDRGFLSLIKKLGEQYLRKNKIIFVNSSNDEVKRPSVSDSGMNGISDPEDFLKFDCVIKGGPNEYTKWFNSLAHKRSIKNKRKL